MRFIDEAKIRIAAGHGGRGCVSFRREAFVPRGGPDGGDGGDGGNIIVWASSQLGTLQDFRYKRVYQAKNGRPGSGANKAGRDGEDIEIRVPLGTVIRDTTTGEVLIDMAKDKQSWVACRGGRGGKGNAHFATSTFQTPKFAQPGEDGEAKELILELKLLADIGIIGLPNAGKSTLISRLSAARPKIADYPFTTLTPNLGVVKIQDYDAFVIADVPGLIEGAHKVAGLGHKFLKHIERTNVLIHLLDGAAILEDAAGAETLFKKYNTIRHELEMFDKGLLNKPEVVAINKTDVLQPDTAKKIIKKFRRKIPNTFLISGVSGEGISDMLACAVRLLKHRETA